jgi:PAS domain S-box-containing protein
MTVRSILVVEDEAVIALDLCDKLEQMGFNVVGTADTGERALALARETRPSLVLMDIFIKGPVDGIDTAGMIRRELNVPVVFLTSFSDDETVRRAALTAPYGYLTKPYKPRELRAAIEVALQKAALESQLQDSERWFASTLRCAHDGIIVTDNDGKIRFLNPAAEQLTGWTIEDARDHAIDEVLRYADGAISAGTPSARALRESRVAGIVRARPLRRRDGNEVPVDESAAPVLDDSGRPMGIVVNLRDATARVQQEQRLQRSEEQFRIAFGNSAAGMALVAMSGRFLQVNDALARFLGYTRPELLELNQEALTFPDDIENERTQLFDLVTDLMPVVQFEKRYWNRDHSQLLWAMVSVTLMSEHGDPVCYTYQIHDITHRKAVELERSRTVQPTGTEPGNG